MASPHFTLAQAERQAGTCAWASRQFIGKTPPLRQEDVNRVVGKTVIVTGANSGLGLEATRQLLDLRCGRVILAVRSVSRGEKAREELLVGRDAATCPIEVWDLDLLSYDSIVKFAKRAETLDRLDIAILNAGHYREREHFTSSTGYEDCVQVNYVSTMLLAVLLLPLLKSKSAKDQPGRLVIVSSDTASWAKFKERTERPILAVYKKTTNDWNHGERYGTSKLLGQLFVHKLVEKVPASAVTIDLVNPGLTYGTEMLKDGNGRLIGQVYKIGFRALGKAPALGALAIVHAAVSFGEAAHGQYTEDGEIRPLAAIIYTPQGKEIANQVWEETLAELSFAPIQESLQVFAN